ncbi:guanylate kinase [Legionella quinlivanii]|uniref:Guanylate kinase n=1 Tax=Legionella quinlivanii TaxID=45073 RepID=A0A0W0XZH0_9GAMM|nr:guanylate kinase [Legionella quinlivanii]KTD50183.1 guanylate kinase [Legionella quinlivanii]MCW8450072.1 guanylate kinase [Legionella quinlivanii]SEF48385.1 guanylate kinase [Legionella quinlivanii DSM 21216]STY11781.1 guanylate kinase [Legionella quinlivanii]
MANDGTGNLFIVAAPSGGGKTSLVKELVNSMPDIEVSVSHTTRSMRPAEKNGVDYFFVSESEFLRMINDSAFIEYARVFNHYYGTSVAQIKDRLAAGIDVVLDIDWQGAQQIRRLFPGSVSIFIIPPSLEILKQRLQNRKQDNEAVIGSRMLQAQEELSHYSEFDYLIVNDSFEVASAELRSIVLANRLNIQRQSVKIAKLLSFLLASK